MNPSDVQQYEFVQVWHVQHPEDRGTMMDKGAIPDICDFNDGEDVQDVGFPPAHYNCLCDTRVVIREKP